MDLLALAQQAHLDSGTVEIRKLEHFAALVLGEAICEIRKERDLPWPAGPTYPNEYDRCIEIVQRMMMKS